jgi:hypothetical protein
VRYESLLSGISPVVLGSDVLPDGRFQIVLNLAAGKGAVCGLRSQHVVIDTARITSLMGVVLRPEKLKLADLEIGFRAERCVTRLIIAAFRLRFGTIESFPCPVVRPNTGGPREYIPQRFG